MTRSSLKRSLCISPRVRPWLITGKLRTPRAVARWRSVVDDASHSPCRSVPTTSARLLPPSASGVSAHGWLQHRNSWWPVEQQGQMRPEQYSRVVALQIVTLEHQPARALCCRRV